MNADDFHALCRDPATPVETLVAEVNVRYSRFFDVIMGVADDEKCAAVLRFAPTYKYEWYASSPMYAVFLHRSLDFYLRYASPPLVLHFGALFDVLAHPWVDPVDVANKVTYLLGTASCTPTDILSYIYVISIGMNHRLYDVRTQFPAVSFALAVFLLRVPPRVQCRVLESGHPSGT